MEFEHLSGDISNDMNSLKAILEKYLIHLKWFILSLVLFLTLGISRYIYQTPQYNISATVLIKEIDQGNSISDLSGFQDLGLFGSGDQSLENEIQILKSRKLMLKVIEELELNTRYFVEDSPYNIEYYPDHPISIYYLSDSIPVQSLSGVFKIKIISKSQFEFIGFDEISLGIKKFGQVFSINTDNLHFRNNISIRIEPNREYIQDLVGETVLISNSASNVVADRYMNKLVIEPVNESLSNVLMLSINDPVRLKGIALINNLIQQYNADAINDKMLVSQTTTDFLDVRIELISAELSVIEGTAEQFKTRNRMVDPNVGANLFLESSSSNENKLISVNTQLAMSDFMIEEITENENVKPLPSNIGITDVTINGLIFDYNSLILQRNRILESSSIINPIIIGIDSQLEVLKNNLLSSLGNINSSLQMQIDALSIQGQKINSRISSVPKNEREFKNIVRQQEVKNELYLFLLQKREESILSNAISVEKIKVIDSAYSKIDKVSPKPLKYLLGSITLGLLIPFLIVYIKEVLDTKVHDEQDLKKTGMPYIGDIPLFISKKSFIISEGDDSSVAEAFRYIRTNLNFLLDKRKEKGKTILITSTISGEGKTFTAINLAISFALSGKKTLLLGMDLRAPKMSQYLSLDDELGITNYIKNKELSVKDIINKYSGVDSLHIVNSGDIPPNPVELLMNQRVENVFEYIKEKYEYIIVDTAPIGLVTDALQVSKYADISLYILKANLIDKRQLHIPMKLRAEKKLPNLAILLNGTDKIRTSYGYGYGYGNKTRRNWFMRFFN